jgi:hypothetical protein
MIDLKKKYKTRSGRRVINLSYVPLNSAGKKVTYPVKGTVVLREKPLKTTYMIWSEDGYADVVWEPGTHKDDLIEVA